MQKSPLSLMTRGRYLGLSALVHDFLFDDFVITQAAVEAEMSKRRVEKSASNRVWKGDLHELLHDPRFTLGSVSFALSNDLFAACNVLFTLRHARFAVMECL